jgi:hypothetical protein
LIVPRGRQQRGSCRRFSRILQWISSISLVSFIASLLGSHTPSSINPTSSLFRHHLDSSPDGVVLADPVKMISTMPLLPFLFPLFPLSALAVVPNNGYTLLTPPLTTDWTYSAGLDPWTRYPRPQMVRQAWQSLNGVWAWKNASGGLEDLANPPTGETLEEAVLVPSCLESALSGELPSLNVLRRPSGGEWRAVMRRGML